MATRSDGARRGIFFGWWVVAGLFLINMVSSGFGFYAQAPFIRALIREQGLSAGLTGSATGLFFVVSGLTGYLSSGLIQRIDVRWMLCIGSLVAGAALFLLGRSTEVWQMFAANVLFGVGFSWCGLLPATTVVTRWFVRRRSIALSVASTGLSAGGIILTLRAASLISSEGLAAVTPWLAVLWIAIVIPVALLMVRPWPQTVGLQPDGDAAPPGGGRGGPPPGFSFAEARRTRFYVLLTAAYVFIMVAQVGGLAHQTNLVTQRVSSALGDVVVSVTAAASVVGRLAGGVVVLRYPAKRVTTILIAVQAVGLALLSVAGTTPAVILSCVVFGLAVGNLLMLHPLLLADAFGVREYAKVYGFSQLMMTLGVGLGPALVGFIEDGASYGVAYAVAAGSSVVAFTLFASSGRAPEGEPERVALAST